MTDEEKAEEYGKQWCDLCDKKNKCKSICFKVEVSTQDYAEGYAEDRKEKWHDLRKNPDDLPIKNDEYLCFVYEHGYKIHRFNISQNCFLGVFSRVVAWCEIPEFKE